jgi:hypothetical protein
MSKDNKGGFKKTASGWDFQRGLIKKTKFDVEKNLTDYKLFRVSNSSSRLQNNNGVYYQLYFKNYGNDIETALR